MPSATHLTASWVPGGHLPKVDLLQAHARQAGTQGLDHGLPADAQPPAD